MWRPDQADAPTAVREPGTGFQRKGASSAKTESASGSAQSEFGLSRSGSDSLTLLGPRIAISGLGECGVEIFRSIAKRDPPLAVRRAAIGLSRDPPINDDIIDGTSDLHQLLRKHLAGPVERDQVGDAVSLARHHHDAAGLDRDVGD